MSEPRDRAEAIYEAVADDLLTGGNHGKRIIAATFDAYQADLVLKIEALRTHGNPNVEGDDGNAYDVGVDDTIDSVISIINKEVGGE